jgi:N-acetylmuramoyl-L-alanine amidase-like protein
MALLHSSWKPVCDMKRIILHWTAGGHTASEVDKQHYHILIESDGTVVRGDHSIKDNVGPTGDNYAAHTLRLNTKSIGVSVCCMANAEESPFKPGPFPMTKTQWLTMAEVAAELAKFYEIPLSKRTILGHGEVQRVLDVMQRGKWDPMVLPWDTSLSKAQVGDAFRAEVARHME